MIVGFEYDFIHYILFKNGPSSALGEAERFPENRSIARVGQIWDSGIFDEIEKGFQDGVLKSFGGLILTFAVSGQKGENFIRG